MNKLCITFLLLCSPSFAQDWSVREGDVLLNSYELETLLVGHEITFYDGGSSRFTADGVYGYTYGAGGTALGQYTVEEDSTVCVTYGNGFARCDLYVMNNDRLIVITEEGDRYPIRPENSS
ncbi:hypothetical protein [Cochlodiniinecator piscidefendens]|uniref:hypothetical protein n=1 Tax=Cochlodiniinecator piscidefendens TaxID=2715756 RepID=UPI001407BBE8|nr:hypothetical protein [Cochlodiniinecator piscidefendens]